MLQPQPETSVKLRSSCDACLSTKVKCSQTKLSCARCIQHGRKCVYSKYRKIGRPSARTSVAADQQRTAKDTDRKSKKQAQQQQTPQTPSQAHVQAQTQTQLPEQAPRPSNGAADGLSPKPICADAGYQPSSNARRSAFPDLDAENAASLAGDPIPNLDMDITNSELMATFTNSLDYGMDIEGIDWVGLEGMFDFDASIFASGNQLQLLEPHNHRIPGLGDVITGPPSPLSCGSSSRGSSSRDVLDALYSPPTPAIERLFSSRSPYSFFAGNGPFAPSSLPPESSQIAPASSPMSTFASAGMRVQASDLFSISMSSRCMLQCQAILTSQLTDISELQKKDPPVTLDVLLNLDDHVRSARDKILCCISCLTGPGCTQTLMLLAMVVGNLLGLFEGGCGTSSGESGVGRGSVLPSGKSSLHANTPTRLRNPLPSTPRALTVGVITLDEDVKATLSRRLLRMYAERQVGVVKRLNQLLRSTGEAEARVVSAKVTGELLGDAGRRLDRFTGSLRLSTGCSWGGFADLDLLGARGIYISNDAAYGGLLEC